MHTSSIYCKPIATAREFISTFGKSPARAHSAVSQDPRRRCRGGSRACSTALPSWTPSRWLLRFAQVSAPRRSPPATAAHQRRACQPSLAARSRARSAVWQGPRRRCRGGSRACATDLPTSQRFVAQRLCVEFRGGQNKKLYIYKLPIIRFCGPILTNT